MAKTVAVGIAALITLNLVIGGFLFIFLVVNFVVALFPILILILIGTVILSISVGGRKVAEARKAT